MKDRVRRLVRDWAVALGAGLLTSLVALLLHAHILAILIAGILACAAVSIALEVIIARKRRAPLIVKPKGKAQWGRLNNAVSIVAVQVEVRNITGDAIAIEGYDFNYETSNGIHATVELSDAENEAFEQIADAGRYFPPLRGFTEAGAHTSIVGWYVAPVGRGPADGTPKCVITVKDYIGNQYHATIPAQKPHIYPS
jgi:hypothetical protein